MRKIFITCLASLFILSCAKDELPSDSVKSLTTKHLDGKNDNYEIKKQFALALHKAFVDYPELRKFIKDEALKKFDLDYDVLYNFVKDKPVGNTTFRNILLEYFEDEKDLLNIEELIPTLTIYVPKLPKNSFSAESWNVNSEVPFVAIRLLHTDKTPIISSTEKSYLLPGNAIPGFPVVLIKECERIVTSDLPSFGRIKTRHYTAGRFDFVFSDIIFDNINPVTWNNPYEDNVDELVNAWNVNGQEQNLGWQRDHVYYGINPTNPNGPFINNYQEQIVNFRIAGTGLEAYDNIVDPSSVDSEFNDPSLYWYIITDKGVPSAARFWRDGEFDFKVILDHGAKSGSNVLTKPFTVSPENLFDLEFDTQSVGPWPCYVLTDIIPKDYQPDVELATWRLEDFSNQWLLHIYEVDLEVENQETVTSNVKYNSNFEIEASAEVLAKIGMKYGSSVEENQSKSLIRKWMEQSNDLGEYLIHFGDNVIIQENNEDYIYREYNLGKCIITTRPVKVQ
ncbi:hypothetical protein [Flavobacterium sp. NRK1]|uniref:hypothetical protein n=1 Tax=Flavobacterium sp. NRK1 TaxID=2954929 RepID=UPI0020936A65|nr:hypothetical protein [Flavobacterium sp. NRK1]MCO6147899.1 hypothetical protein [Flavobacterium sp. NRK1]